MERPTGDMEAQLRNPNTVPGGSANILHQKQCELVSVPDEQAKREVLLNAASVENGVARCTNPDQSSGMEAIIYLTNPN